MRGKFETKKWKHCLNLLKLLPQEVVKIQIFYQFWQINWCRFISGKGTKKYRVHAYFWGEHCINYHAHFLISLQRTCFGIKAWQVMFLHCKTQDRKMGRIQRESYLNIHQERTTDLLTIQTPWLIRNKNIVCNRKWA